jgi:hypothetical protein
LLLMRVLAASCSHWLAGDHMGWPLRPGEVRGGADAARRASAGFRHRSRGASSETQKHRDFNARTKKFEF